MGRIQEVRGSYWLLLRAHPSPQPVIYHRPDTFHSSAESPGHSQEHSGLCGVPRPARRPCRASLPFVPSQPRAEALRREERW